MADQELTTSDLAGEPRAEDEIPESDVPDANREVVRGEVDRRIDAAGDGRDVAGAERHVSGEAREVPREPLLPDEQGRRFTERWQEIQASFVDEPRESVQQADALVADLMQRLAAGFSSERERLEGQWDRGDDVSTEDLRVALTRYRTFFDRLLAA
jgi:hypothetical protein